MSKTKMVQSELRKETLNRLSALRRRCGAKNDSEVIRRLFALHHDLSHGKARLASIAGTRPAQYRVIEKSGRAKKGPRKR